MFGSDYKHQNYRRKKREPDAHVGRERIEHHARQLANRGGAHRERFDRKVENGNPERFAAGILPTSVKLNTSERREFTAPVVEESPKVLPSELPREVLPEGIGKTLNIVA